MNWRVSLLVVTFLGLSVFPLAVAGPGGGGHGGGGHSGGHFGGGSSSGHSFGHSVGHSLGHIFGHRSGGRGTRIEKNPIGDGFGPARPFSVAHIHIRPRRRMFPGNRFFSSGYCDSFRFSWRGFLVPGEFDCFDDAFLFDPFFYGASLNTYFWSDSLTDSLGSADSGEPPEAVENDLPPSAEKPGAAVPLPSNAEESVVLLQLLDGLMYGVTRYWQVGTTLHYVTTYGGENSVPLERIDLANTQRLNAERGTRFDLTQNSHQP